MDLYDEIYFTLLGELDPPLPGIPNAFTPGSPCAECYGRMMHAKQRLLDRLCTEEDPDVERILEEMQAITRHLCRTVMQLRQF